MYIKNSNLSPYKIGQLVTEWIYNTPATVCAKRIGISRVTANWWYNRIRQVIADLPEPPPFDGCVEIDETYLGRKRPNIIGTGTADKIAVFGIRHRDSGKVWATVVKGTNHTFLIPLIQQRVAPGTMIFSDGFGAYYHLNKLGYRHHVVNHHFGYVASKIVHTNGIESFWGYMKKLFKSRNGIRRDRYQIHVKEALYRFNNRKDPNFRQHLIKLIIKSL